jgi:tripartite-type tricarboxylate transporter receptor subunit TctC
MIRTLIRLPHRQALLVLLALAASGLAHAAGYPEQPVTLIVPFSTGGDADLAARNLQPVAQRVLGQPAVVMNRAGASGSIGSQAVKAAKPDGYTLLLARVGSQVVLPALQPSLPYKWSDFTLIGLLELNPVVCAVRTESPLRTLKDLADALRANPGKLNYSSSGQGTILHLGPQLLFEQLKLGKEAAVQVVYKGGSEAALAVLTGEVDFSCGNLTSMVGNIKGGRLRALVTTTPERLKDLPEVPTAREAGFPKLETIVGWSALYGPPGLPRAIVDQWVQVLQAAAADPQWLAATERAGSLPRVLSPADTERYVAEQFKVYESLGKSLQIEFK